MKETRHLLISPQIAFKGGLEKSPLFCTDRDREEKKSPPAAKLSFRRERKWDICSSFFKGKKSAKKRGGKRKLEGFFLLHSFLLSFLLRPGQLASARGAGHTPYSLFSCVYPWPRTPPAQVDTQVSSSSTCSELLCSTHTTTKKSTFFGSVVVRRRWRSCSKDVWLGWEGKGWNECENILLRSRP